MKPESKRARRRHARWRAVKRALNLFRMFDSDTQADQLDARGLHVKRRAHDPEKLADNLKSASHPGCCSHLREIEGPTVQELRQIEQGDLDLDNVLNYPDCELGPGYRVLAKDDECR